MKTQVMFVGGPHNGALTSHSHIGAGPPTDLYVGAVESVVTGKVKTSRYRLMESERMGPANLASYEYLGEEEKRQSLVDMWL